MGGSVPMDVERKGSIDWGRGNKTIYPMQDSPRPAIVPFFEARPNRRRSSWIISLFVVLNIVIFIVAMFINDCPKDLGENCSLKFLGRFSFQPLKENPLFGPSSLTYNFLYICKLFVPCAKCVICMYESQMQYGSIGWSVGATLGFAQAIPEKTCNFMHW